MKVCLVVLGLVALSAAAPQNWPYRDSLMPYRYGYPTQTQYKYLPQIEDDEDVGPYLGVGRQDVVVGSDGDRVRPTPESVAPGVVETGSVAPVVEATKAPAVVPPPRVSAPPPKPVGPGPVQPPVFPPARPPPTPPSRKVKDEEDEDEDENDESDEEEADDETGPNEDEDDDGAGPDDDNDEEEEEEEERRRQEPLNSDETVEVPSSVVVDKVNKPVPVVPAPQPVVAPTPPKQPVVVSESSVEDVNATQVVESNEVGQSQNEDESSEEQGLGGGVEALVPGYVTDQGEVLVPVDTVTGDQPISIVPDPYSPPARGIQLRGGSHTYRSPYDEDIGYANPYYYPEGIYENLGRQDESEEENVSSQNPDDEDNSNSEEESTGGNAEGRNEYLTAFPPSRSPELFALINSRVQEQQIIQQRPFQGPYAPQRYQAPYQQQQQPILYRVRQQENNPSVSLAVRVTGGGGGGFSSNNINPYVNRFTPNQYGYQESGEDQFSGYVPPYHQGLRGPYSPNPYRPRPQYNRPYGSYGYPSAVYGVRPRPQYRPRPVYAGGAYQRPYGPRPVYGGQRPRPVFRPSYNPYRGPQNVVIRRRPIAASITPIPIAYKTKAPGRPLSNKFVNKRPTPIEYQDEEPYPFETPFVPYGREPVEFSPYGRPPVNPSFAPNETQESVEQGPRENKKAVPAVAPKPKSRRAAKMAKKMNKKTMEKKKKTTDPDPLNILKKINLKRS